MIGELEKRINKMLFLSHAGKDLDDDYEQKRVHQIIEEAKKDAKWAKLDWISSMSKDAKEWFIKWLGEK